MKYLRPALCSLLFVIAGCAKQGEGDRCLRSNGNGDCASGLVCIASDDLAEQTADRCCPEDGHSSDSRCTLRSSDTQEPQPSSNSTAGTGPGGAAGEAGQSGNAGQGGSGGASGSAGATTAGAAA